MKRSKGVMVVSAVAALASGTARADEAIATRAERLALFVAVGYLASPGANGGALSTGMRVGLARHFAMGFDLGYGVVGAPADTVQDRWWLMPSVSLVLPADPVRFELGVGLGLGAASGYASLPAYLAGPFDPDWAFQLVPAARAHGIGTVDLTRTLDLFIRMDAASLLLGGNPIGSRVGNPHPRITDTLWVTLSIGVQFRLR